MTRYTNPVPQIEDDDGKPIVGAKKYFFETNSSTLKTVYSDAALSLPIDNPVLSDSGGRFPSIFIDGIYREVQHDDKGVLMWDEPIGELPTGQAQLWSVSTTYNIPEIVYGSDDEYYRSLTDSNVGNNPTTSPAAWELVKFTQVWNTNVTYSLNAIVIGSDGVQYSSNIASNFGNNPTANPDDWQKYEFINTWSTLVTYDLNEPVIGSDNIMYESLIASNAGNDPLTSPTQWGSVWNAPVANYVKGTTEYIEADVGANATGLTVDTIIAAAWESVGPTGSGATNIWTALDALPTSIRWVEILIVNQAATAVGPYAYQTLYGRVTGSSTAIADSNALSRSFSNPTGGGITGNIIEVSVPRKIPVDSLNRLDLYRVDTAGISGLNIYLIGPGV